MEIKEKDRALFMKYALPCSCTLIKRGSTTKENIDNLIQIVKNGEKIPENAEKIFKVALSSCSIIAIDSGKDAIDEKIIRDYFILNHDKVIDKRYQEMKDFDPDSCRIKYGTVNNILGERAEVLIDEKILKYRTDFTPGLKKNDKVVVHWDFIVEKLNNIEKMEVGALNG